MVFFTEETVELEPIVEEEEITIDENLSEKEENNADRQKSREMTNVGNGNVNKSNNDQGIVCDTGTGLHYKAGDEPEPIDLTHLNIEAAMMCLASKIRLLCGKANSPTLSSRTFRFKELDIKRGNSTNNDNFKVCI